MVTFVSSIHFLSLREDIIVKDADIGAFRYQDKGNTAVSNERVYYNLRKQYIESRGGCLVLKNTRPTKLKDTLKELEECLSKDKVILEGWKSATNYQICFSSGTIVLLTINISNGSISGIVFDKFLQGKLLSENVSDVIYSSNYLLFSYNDSCITMVHITKPINILDGKLPCRVSSQEPKVITCENIGPPGRRFERKLSINMNEDMVLVWWKTGDDEVYPWSPLNKDRDRSNLLVYSLSGSSLELLSFCRTEMPPLSVSFSKNKENVILTVEQGFDKYGGVTVLCCTYEVDRSTLHRISVTSIPLDAPVTAHAYNPCETRLLLACNNGVLALHCESRGMTHVTKAGLIPSCISWVHNGTLVLVSNERGQLQCFDLALSLIRIQLLLEDFNPLRILDFSDYFCHQQLLQNLKWAPSCDQLIPCVMLHFTQGPLACLRILCGESFGPKDAPSISLSATMLVSQYVIHKQFDEAINLLVSLSWEVEGNVALECLCTIVSALLKLPLNIQREAQVEAVLSSFLIPPVPLSPATEEEYGPPVRAATRRFFFKVLRKGRLEKAYRLALDLNDYDCFLNVHHVARCHGNKNLASLSLQSARELNSDSCWSGSCSSFLCSDSSDSDSCSQSCSSSCSTCSSISPEISNKMLSDINEESCVSDSQKGGEEVNPNRDEMLSNCALQTGENGTISISIVQGRPQQQARPVALEDLKRPFPQGRLKTVQEEDPPSSDEEPRRPPPERRNLRKQYKAAFQEVTTEEEDGSTVKVVHFGVV